MGLVVVMSWRLEREGKWVVHMGFQRWSDDMEMDHDLQTQHAVARVFGSRRWEIRTRTSQGGGPRQCPMSMFGLLCFQFHSALGVTIKI